MCSLVYLDYSMNIKYPAISLRFKSKCLGISEKFTPVMLYNFNFFTDIQNCFDT